MLDHTVERHDDLNTHCTLCGVNHELNPMLTLGVGGLSVRTVTGSSALRAGLGHQSHSGVNEPMTPAQKINNQSGGCCGALSVSYEQDAPDTERVLKILWAAPDLAVAGTQM